MSRVLQRPLRGTQALSAEDFARIREAGGRLRGEFLALFENVPVAVRRTRALSRHLNVDRNTCHRLLTALNQRADDEATVIAKLPGVAGMRLIVDAIEAAGARKRDVRAASAAIEHFATLIDELGGSLSEVQRRCAVSSSAPAHSPANADPGEMPGVSDMLAARRTMHAAASSLVGRRLDAHLSIMVLRPLPGNPKMLEHLGVNALIGHSQTRPDALPFALAYCFSGPDTWCSETGPEYNDLSKRSTGQELIPKFCSQPLPTVTVRRGSKGHHQQIFDTAGISEKQDIVAGCRLDPVAHVADHEVPVFNNVVRLRFPAERLVFDVYLHRSLAMSSVPTVGAYAVHPGLVDDLSKFWYERMPLDLRIEILGPSIRNARTDAWSRHQELTTYVFERLGWNGDEYVGYRVSLAYPIWGLFYYMTSDFAKGEAPE